MGRPSNSEARRRQILAGFRQVLAEQGYDGATIADIAKATGVSAGLLHYHFADKQGILLALIADLAAESGDKLDAALAVVGEAAWARVDAYLGARLKPAGAEGACVLACWVAVSAEAVREVAVRRAYEAAIAAEVTRVTPLIEAVLAEAGREAGEAPAIAAGILALVHGYYMLGTASPWLIPPGSAWHQACRMARGLVHGAGA